MPTVCIDFLVPIFMMFFSTSLAFIEEPTTLIAQPNTTATFRCRHQTANAIGWLINGTSIISINNPDITPNINDENNPPVNTLTIVARPRYNETAVVCVATFFNGLPAQQSSVVMLIVRESDINDTNFNSPTTSSIPANGFVEVPSSVTVAVDQEAVFRCQHSSANSIEWIINGTSLGDFHPLNITQTIPLLRSDLHTLSIQALTSYNQTSVKCVAFLDSLLQLREGSLPVLLFIQGPLLSIRNLTITNFSLLWEPPFTLDLTNVHPDIVYCVDIYNVSCAGREHLISDCSLTESTYPYGNSHQRTDLLEYVIIPRNNAQNSRNGTPQVLQENFLLFNTSNFQPIITKSDTKVLLSLKYNYDVEDNTLQKTLDSYSIQLESVDSGQSTFMEYISSSTQKTESGITIHFNDTLEQRRIWNYLVKALVCGGIPLSNRGHISTHELQNIEVQKSTDNSITITSNRLNGSQATGMFVVAYSLNDDLDVHYSIHTRSKDQHRIVAELSELHGNRYNVSIFSLENGIPFARAATRPKSVDFSKNKGVPVSQSTTAILNCVYVNNNSFTETACINCAITNPFDGNCVAIAHVKTSLLVNSSHGLMDIKVHFLRRSLDSALCSGCIDGISIDNYVISVFTYQTHMGIFGPHVTVSQPRSSDYTAEHTLNLWQILIAVLITIVVLLTLVTLVIVIVIINWRHKMNCTMSKDKIQMRACDAYKATKLARGREPMDQNPAYGIVEESDSSIKVKECPAYEAIKKSMTMEENPSYGELGHTIYETILT